MDILLVRLSTIWMPFFPSWSRLEHNDQYEILREFSFKCIRIMPEDEHPSS